MFDHWKSRYNFITEMI